MEVYNSMKSISISEQIIPRKPLIAISSNKLKGKSLEKDESKNIYYESISKEISEYDNSIEDHQPQLLYRTTDGKLAKQYITDIPEWAQILI